MATRGYLTIWATGVNADDFRDLEQENYLQLSQVIDCATGARRRLLGLL